MWCPPPPPPPPLFRRNSATFAVPFRQGGGDGGDGRWSVCENRVRPQSSEFVRRVLSSAAAAVCLSPENPRFGVLQPPRQTDRYNIRRFVVYTDYGSQHDHCRRSITAYLLYSVVRGAITKTGSLFTPKISTSTEILYNSCIRRFRSPTFRSHTVVCRVCYRAMITNDDDYQFVVDDLAFYIIIFTYT